MPGKLERHVFHPAAACMLSNFDAVLRCLGACVYCLVYMSGRYAVTVNSYERTCEQC